MFVFANSINFTRNNHRLFAITKLCIIVLFIFTLCCFMSSQNNSCQALCRVQKNVNLEQSVGEEIEENIDKQLSDIDLSELDGYINNLSDKEKVVLGNNSFFVVVKKFINAEDGDIYGNFLPYAVNIIFDNLLSYIPYFAIIIIFAICFSLIGQFSGADSSLSKLIHMIFFSAISVIVLKIVLSLLSQTSQSINNMQGQIECVFPILLTLITAIGSSVTAATFQPMLAIFSSGISKLFNSILVPIFVFSIVFGVIGNLSKNIKLDKFSKFFSSLYNWIIGIVFTIFIAFLTIHGLTTSSIDNISFRTAKYAIKSYVPILGGYLSDGINVIVASSVLVKNAIGVSGLVVMLLTIFAPVINIIVVILLLKFSSAILEPICDKEMSSFLFSISKALNMLIVAIVAVGFMYIISASLLMSCSNLI